MRAQGALEYLIIIAAVLAISAVVVLFITGTFTASSSGADISKCRLAAANCQRDITLGVGSSCTSCNTACLDAKGKEVIGRAVKCCKSGLVSDIYAGSTKCLTPEAFYEEFQNIDSWQKWTQLGGWISGASGWGLDTTTGNNSNCVAMTVSGGSAATSLKHAESTVGYNSIYLSWSEKLYIPDDANGNHEAFAISWSSNGGTTWNIAYNVNNRRDTSWSTPSAIAIPIAAWNNPDFVVSFYCYSWTASSYCKVDSFRIIGTPIP